MRWTYIPFIVLAQTLTASEACWKQDKQLMVRVMNCVSWAQNKKPKKIITVLALIYCEFILNLKEVFFFFSSQGDYIKQPTLCEVDRVSAKKEDTIGFGILHVGEIRSSENFEAKKVLNISLHQSVSLIL